MSSKYDMNYAVSIKTYVFSHEVQLLEIVSERKIKVVVTFIISLTLQDI